MTGHRDTFKPLFTWRTAIVESDLPPTARHLALTLSIHMNEVGGSCFPSNAQLARETGLNSDTVTRHLTTLSDAGYLKREFHRQGPDRGTWVEYEATTPRQTRCGPDSETTTTARLRRDHSAFKSGPQRAKRAVSSSSLGLQEDVKTKTLDHPVDDRVRPDEALKAVKTFDDFWAQYPRKVSRNAARKAWDRLSVKDKDLAFVGLMHWIVYWETAKTAPQYIKHASTWLNGREWDDVPDAATTLTVVGPRIVEYPNGYKRNMDSGALWDPTQGAWLQDREWRPGQK